MGLGAYIADVQGRTYMEFLAPGLVVSTSLFTGFFETSYGFYVKMTFENIFKAMLATPIGINEVIIGEFIWVAIKGAVMSLVLTLVLAAFGLVHNPQTFFIIPLLGALITIPCGALGLLSCSFIKSIDQFQSIYSFLISPLFFFSGIFFPVSQMPKPLLLVTQILPLSHAVSLSQMIFWGDTPQFSHLINLLVLLLYSVVLGYWSYVRIKKILIS
jgi:lipooligosaccharide transport system permease protein